MSGYKNINTEHEYFSQYHIDNSFNLVNPPATCWTWGTDGSKNALNMFKIPSQSDPIICPGEMKLLTTGDRTPYLTFSKATELCDVMGPVCQGVIYADPTTQKQPLSSTSHCPLYAEVKNIEQLKNQPCFDVKTSLQPTSLVTGDCGLDNNNTGTKNKCIGLQCNITGGGKFSWLKQQPTKPDIRKYKTSTDTSLSLAFPSKTGDFNLVNPPATCWTWGTDGSKNALNMFKIPSQTDLIICPGEMKLLTTGDRTPYLTFSKATELCDVMGPVCQGVIYADPTMQKQPLSSTSHCPLYAEVKNIEQLKNQPCFDVKTSLQPTSLVTGDCGIADSITAGIMCKGLQCNITGGNNFTWLKTGNSGLSPASGLWCLASITKIPKVGNGNIEHVEIKDLKVGDIVQTTRGNMPISDIMKTDTRGYVHDNYVKVENSALGENFPSEDLYVTHEHSFSLGYYKNSLLNRNIHDNDQDDMVYLHITADQLADKLPGVNRVSKEFESAINLVFDEHTSINVYGLDIVTHHPKGNPHILSEEKYQDKSKFNNKVQKPLFVNYNMLENAKPEHMEMKDFLRGCITADLNNKLNLEDVNNISFTPQKTILTDDLRQKLKVL